MKIRFKRISFKNVLSYGNKETSFQFKNGIDLVLGTNGKGKSTLVDALNYVLFGKPFRKIKIGELINNKNGKNLYVELEFSVNDKNFKIQRGMKPEVFNIFRDNEGEWKMVEKHSTNRDYQRMLEEEILMFGENVFRQLIALGANLSSSKNFMELSKSEKEEVLQVITDTAIFNDIKNAAREKKLIKKTAETDLNYKATILNSNIESSRVQFSIMEEQNRNFLQNKERIIEQKENEKRDLEEKLHKLKEALEKITETQLYDYQKKRKIVANKLEAAKENERSWLFKERKIQEAEKSKIVCPKCSHEIKTELPFSKEEVLTELKTVKETISKLEAALDKLDQAISKLEAKEKKRSEIINAIAHIENKLESLQREIQETSEWKVVEIDYSELRKMEQEFEKVKNDLISVRKEIKSLEAIENLVSDKKLKGIILNQQLPFLNKHINEFLEMFDSQFNFVLDANFKETIVSRNRNNDFNALSNGQKQRISLSILFAFLKLIEERNGINTNLLILDEYLDSSLDVEGIEEVMNILSQVFGKSKDVILISHNPEIKSKLELLNRVIEIDQEEGFSIMKVEEL
jgi:DNA repair exonuclease SbcCD ATPase subunit